jgi:uncharacterized protein
MKTTLVSAQYSGDRLKKSVLQILEDTVLCSMATMSLGHDIHINTAYFCYTDALDIYFVSDPSTKHGQNIAQSPTVAVAVYNSNQPWDKAHRGLQLFGTCRLASLTESARALASHAARFHAYGEYIKALNPLDREASVYKFYIFQPNSIKIYDEPEFGEETFILAEVSRG